MSAAARAHRGTIFLEQGVVLTQQKFAAEQYVLRLQAPRCAAAATPGTFVHLQVDDAIPMRRPLSLLRVDAAAGWIEILYKVHGTGLACLAQRRKDERMSVLGPIGVGFAATAARPRAVLVGGGVGIPPLVFLAERLIAADSPVRPIAFFGSEVPFPFATRASTILVPGMPPGSIAAMSELDAIGVPSRLASRADLPGCFDGLVTELADRYLAQLTPQQLAATKIFSCGPTPMLRAVAALARRFALPAQVALEEYMACGVGGCAGCAVRVITPSGPAMKRVCVDGPVFEAATVFPDD